MDKDAICKIFNILNENDFNQLANDVFDYQYSNNLVYQNWCKQMAPYLNKSLAATPFLPISFFKTHNIQCGSFKPEAIFESSGTTNTINSKHFVKNLELYNTSCKQNFEKLYGCLTNWCVLGLLPSYLERSNSSLVYMVHNFMQSSNHKLNGFYLNNFNELYQTLVQLENNKQPTILFGVSFALLDFIEQFSLQLKHTVIIETGGMKGRREEITKYELHEKLCKGFGLNKIHSEYGMTELLSQAYTTENGKFLCPPWMKVFVRDEEDPLNIKKTGKGVLNIIDLANIYTCSFIATDDIGIVYNDGSFEVLGRLDFSDIRGCSLMIV